MKMILKNQPNNACKTANKNIKLSDQNVLIKKRLLRITYVILVFIVFLFVAPITNVNSMYENDPEKPIKELLDNIKTASIHGSRNAQHGVSLSMPAFSALLVRLSNEASKTADKNIKLSGQNILMQKRLLRITWVMLGINILMFAAQMVKFFGFFDFHDKKKNNITKINDTTAHTDKSEKLDTIDNRVTNDK